VCQQQLSPGGSEEDDYKDLKHTGQCVTHLGLLQYEADFQDYFVQNKMREQAQWLCCLVATLTVTHATALKARPL
jgi:hypothetical protein